MGSQGATRGSLDPVWRRRGRELDTVAGWVRKITHEKVDDFLNKLDAALVDAAPREPRSPTRWPIPQAKEKAEADHNAAFEEAKIDGLECAVEDEKGDKEGIWDIGTHVADQLGLQEDADTIDNVKTKIQL